MIEKFKVGDSVKIEFSSYSDGCPGIWIIEEIFNHPSDPEDQFEAFITQGSTTRLEYTACFKKLNV